MRLFAKRVRDPEVCFCQNVIKVLDGLSYVTTNVAWIAIAKNVLTRRGLMDIVSKHANNLTDYIVEECYPSNRNELLNQAEALFEIISSGVNWQDYPGILVPLGKVIGKMGLSKLEKKKLIIKYLYKGEESEIHSFLADDMSDNIFIP